MDLTKLLSELDEEIARLKAARRVLTTDPKPLGKVEAAATPAKKKKRNISPEGRARIAEAVKRRWAKQKKAAASNGK